MNKEIEKAIAKMADVVRNLYDDSGKIIGNNIEEFVRFLDGVVKTDDGLEWGAEGKLEESVKAEDGKFVISVSKSLTTKLRNYTIAHEIGHLLLHTNYWKSLFDNEELHFDPYYNSKRGTESEQQADEFADNLLMPEEQFRDIVAKNITKDEKLDIKSVADVFGVSVDAAVNRANKLGVAFR